MDETELQMKSVRCGGCLVGRVDFLRRGGEGVAEGVGAGVGEGVVVGKGKGVVEGAGEWFGVVEGGVSEELGQCSTYCHRV